MSHSHHLEQRTLGKSVGCSGVGLHSGQPVRLDMHPAAPSTGIVFVRSDLPGRPEIRATVDSVVDATFATTIGKGNVKVGTVEHLLAALFALGIDNVRVELDGPEVPIMDGSAAPFVFLLHSAGVKLQNAHKKFLVVKKPVAVHDGDKEARLSPAPQFSVSVTIDFKHPLISDQQCRIECTDKSFIREISRARTFGFLRDVQMLKAMGLARGGSLDNAIVVDDFHILNPDGLRYPDEFVRHKILDALGDLSLIGMPVVGHLMAHKTGHALNHRLVRKVLADPTSYEVVVPAKVGEEQLGFRLPVAAAEPA